MSGTESTDAEQAWVGTIASELRAALAEDFGTARLPAAGWTLAAVEPRTFKQRVPVVALECGERHLCFIVTPTNLREPAYRRTARHDVTYFSEDVADEAQGQIYRRDREMIDAFARWMSDRDGPAPSAR
jgi:hypothetical protein